METHPPVYWVDDDNNFHFIENYLLKDKKGFKSCNSLALKKFYRGGGVMCMQVLDCGYIVVYDERHGWYKFPGGEAEFCEGSDLLKSAIREALLEEVIFTGKVDNQEKLLYIEAQRKKSIANKEFLEEYGKKIFKQSTWMQPL